MFKPTRKSYATFHQLKVGGSWWLGSTFHTSAKICQKSILRAILSEKKHEAMSLALSLKNILQKP